jgi:hypothetical protein
LTFYDGHYDNYLQSTNSGGLETQIGLEVLGNFTHQPLEWQFADQQFRGLLVTTDLSQSHSTWAIAMGLLDATSRWGAFTSGLCGQLFARSLSSRGFTSCLLCTGHCLLNKPKKKSLEILITNKSQLHGIVIWEKGEKIMLWKRKKTNMAARKAPRKLAPPKFINTNFAAVATKNNSFQTILNLDRLKQRSFSRSRIVLEILHFQQKKIEGRKMASKSK